MARGHWWPGGTGRQGALVARGHWWPGGTGRQGALVARGRWSPGGAGRQGALVARGRHWNPTANTLSVNLRPVVNDVS